MPRVALTVNGLPVQEEVEGRTSLADFLRNRLNLTGTHLGCEHGVCGACTVLVDGQPARSCIAFVAGLEGRDIRTVEGFEDDRMMQKLREAFHVEHALQCGFCTPGMLVTARDIVTRFPELDEAGIRVELAGNLCRCTGYVGIVNAIQRVMLETGGARAVKASVPRFLPIKPFKPKPEGAREAHAATAVFGPSELAKGWSRISDHFIVDKPREEVWRLFADIPRMTECMPGASFAEADGAEVRGVLRIAFGPIKADFASTAVVERDEARMVGTIRGAGGDARRGAQAKGQVTYQLLDQPGGRTRVQVVVDYQLSGPLAQFGRSGLVKDFARRLIAQFAVNLSGVLRGEAAAASSRSLNAAGILWGMIRARLASLFGRG